MILRKRDANYLYDKKNIIHFIIRIILEMNKDF